MGYNSIGDDGAKAIAEALKVNPVLTKLDLRWNNNMGETGEKAVRDAVKDRSGFELDHCRNECASTVNMCGSQPSGSVELFTN